MECATDNFGFDMTITASLRDKRRMRHIRQWKRLGVPMNGIAGRWKARQLRGNSQVLWENGGYWMFPALIAAIFPPLPALSELRFTASYIILLLLSKRAGYPGICRNIPKTSSSVAIFKFDTPVFHQNNKLHFVSHNTDSQLYSNVVEQF